MWSVASWWVSGEADPQLLSYFRGMPGPDGSAGKHPRAFCTTPRLQDNWNLQLHHSCRSARSSQAEKTRLLRPSPRTSARVSLPPLSISARRTSARQNVGHAGGGLEEGWGSGYAAPFQTTPTPTSCLTQQVTALLWFDCFYCFHSFQR